MDLRYVCISVVLAAVLAGPAGANIGIGENNVFPEDWSVSPLAMAPAQGLPGDIISIPVTWDGRFSDIGSGDLKFFSGTTDCSPYFTITAIEKGALTQNTLFDWKKNDDDMASFSFASGQPVDGSGSIAIITATVKGTAGNDGGKGCDFRVEGSIFTGDGTDLGVFGITGTSSTFTLAPAVKGDGDHDGKVTSNDALAALQMAVGKIPEDLKYDMNSDQKVNSNDVREILKLTVVPVSVAGTGSLSKGTTGALVVVTGTQEDKPVSVRKGHVVSAPTTTTTLTGLEPVSPDIIPKN